MSRTATTIDDAIRRMVELGLPTAEIKRVLHVGQDRITRAKNSPAGTTVLKKSGRPPKVTPAVSLMIEQETLANGGLHDQELADLIAAKTGVVISHDTVRRVRHSLGFNFRPRMTVQELSETQKNQRLEFCQWFLKREDLHNMPIVFSDESRFCEGPDNSWVYVRRGEWNDSVMAPTKKFYKGIMCFGAIGIGFKSELVVCKGTVNSAAYIDNLKNCGVIETMNERYGPFRWLFQQDGATCHTCRESVQWLRQHVNVLPGWPPNSPDLNPIEMLWSIVKHRLEKGAGPIEAQVVRIWNEIDRDIIDRLVLSFYNRCQMVVNTGGSSISQYLSSHMIPEPASGIQATRYSEDMDRDLLQMTRDGEHRNQVIAAELNRRHNVDLSSLEVRQRLKVLTERETMDAAFQQLMTTSVACVNN